MLAATTSEAVRAPNAEQAARPRQSPARRALLILVSALFVVPAGIATAAPRSSMAIDANTGDVLHAIAADDLRHPASLTKMMTLYIVFGLIERGRLEPSDTIPISAQAAAQPPSKLGLQIGETITVADAIRALVSKSANDIAVALAERVSGSEAAFARLMTKTAREIGMPKTVFHNASGLPAPEQVTTARDMLTLAIRLQDDFPKHFKYFSSRSFSFRGKVYRNHNTLLGRVEGVDGIKTGYIRASGFNVVTSMKKDGKNIVAVVFGGSTAAARNAQMQALLARVEGKASTRRTRRPLLIASPRPAARPAPPPAVRPETGDGIRPLLADAVAVGRAEPVAAVSIAKVRRIDVAAAQPLGRQPGYDPLPEPARPRPADGAFLARSVASEPREAPGRPPVEEAFHARQPSSLQDQLARLLAASGSADSIQPTAAAPAQPRAAPQLARAGLQRPSALKGPSRTQPQTSPGATASGYQIQVGAFASESEARSQLDKVAAAAAPLLAGYARETPSFARGDSTVFRARFAGFEANAATDACLELRRRAIDCFVTR
ncbi:MAG: D-alanyl-D-alanine carboxypeptidase [Hyphomicrobiaceae bacterium]|nr:D-alanyl-D-alanine carboxypeptidase [Hyphomicrobiaceae bacterium]